MATSSSVGSAVDDKAGYPTRSRLDACLDAVTLMRPTLLIPLWTLQILGVVHARMVATGWPFVLVPPARLLLLGGAQSCVISAVYILNQITDAPTDAANAKLLLVADRHVARRALDIQMAALVLAGLLLLGIGSLRFGVGVEAWVLIGLSALLGVAYSVPPVRLKARAGLDLLSNGAGFGMIAFAVGWAAVQPLAIEAWALSAPYFFCVAATFAFTTIPDIPGDREHGARTMGVVLGARARPWVGVGALVVAICLSPFVRNGVACAAAFVALPLYTVSAVRIQRSGDDRWLLRTTQIVILTLSFMAALGVPLYAVCVIIVLVYTRWYYAHRFGMRYP